MSLKIPNLLTKVNNSADTDPDDVIPFLDATANSAVDSLDLLQTFAESMCWFCQIVPYP